MDARPGDAARRRRASDHADAGARRQHGDRGRLRAGAAISCVTRDDVETALKAYVAERQPRTARITLQSRQQFADNRKVPPPPFTDRTWIYTFDVTREEGALQSA